MKSIFGFVLFALIFGQYVLSEETTEHLTLKQGYPFEKHWAQTKDGYWLRLHRIPRGKNETKEEAKNKTKDVFFLQHGLTASSSNFVEHSRGIAFILADAGYDVWMGNVRGNLYSYAHAFYKNDTKEYWDFSFDEMAEYDLPAMIDYALINTNQSSLWYVAHSQGTMIMFAKLSDNPEFGFKIKGFFAMAPVAKLDTVYDVIRKGCRYYSASKWIVDKAFHHLPLPYDALKKFLHILCISGLKQFCVSVYRKELRTYGILDFDLKKLSKVLATVFTDGQASTKNLLHYCQAMETGLFQKFDNGYWGNLIFYGHSKPPQYEVSNIRTEIWFYSGTKDVLSSQEDVDWLKANIGDYIQNSVVLEGYDHVAFLKNPRALKDIYENILRIVRDREKRQMQ